MPTDPPPANLDLKNALQEERHRLEHVQVPIITVSATFRKELIKKYHSLARSHTEAIFSRAHYSMAEAVREQALKLHKTAHLVDPTNFVSPDDWSKIAFTEDVGQLMARHHTLKWVKDQIDTVARSKLPISEAITPPLLYLTENIVHTIISMHYEAGNIMAVSGKRILQVLTDPHVRPQYLDPLPPVSKIPSPNPIYFAVFDSPTKKQLLKMAYGLDKQINSHQVIVTGPPVDPRLCKMGTAPKKIDPEKPIHLGITTGGLGTNLDEIKQALHQLAPLLEPPEKIRLFLYAGTHRDFRNFFEDFAGEHNIRIGNLDDQKARIRILHEDSIIDANENLIHYMFPWAHGIITKPSGDMAYDAAAAGCFLLFLEPWGEWEENIQKIFVERGVGFDFKVGKAFSHFRYLDKTHALHRALTKSHNLPALFRSGTKNILHLHATLSKR